MKENKTKYYLQEEEEERKKERKKEVLGKLPEKEKGYYGLDVEGN